MDAGYRSHNGKQDGGYPPETFSRLESESIGRYPELSDFVLRNRMLFHRIIMLEAWHFNLEIVLHFRLIFPRLDGHAE